MKKQWKRGLMLLCAAALLLSSVCGFAEAYPSKGITLVVPWGAGGVTDVAARVFAPLFEKYMGVPVVILNRPGASGAIGTEYAYARPADGYTVLFSAETPASFRIMDVSKLSFHDFEPIMLLSHSEKIIAVAPESPYQTLADLVKDIRARPGKVRFSYSGAGASGHVQALLMMQKGDLDFSSTPFGGGNNALLAVLGGQVDFTSPNIGTVKDYIAAGKLRALAVFDRNKSSYLPDLPPITDAIPEMAPFLPLDYPNCLIVKKGTPTEIVGKIADAASKAVADPAWKEFLENNWYVGLDTVRGQDMLAYWDKWASVVGWVLQDAGVAKKSPEVFNIPRP
jgi:tripartite-type tricarboxylate transporter receptor subunit TctC